MRHGSLFSGIGGFDLAAQWVNWENVFHCEINPIASKILQYYWPNAKTHHDITKTDFTIYRGTIDVLSGGFPCQPFSLAGKRKGTEDSRHLWPEMLRAIREIQPRYVVGENVAGILNWDNGTVFQQVHTDLENEGYEVQAFILPACAVNAPHRRDRVWFVAQNTLFSRCVHREYDKERTGIREQRNIGAGSSDGFHLSKGLTADTAKQGRKKWEQDNGWKDSTEIESGVDNRPQRYGNKWATADTDSDGRYRHNCEDEVNASEGRINALGDIGTGGEHGLTADTDGKRHEKCKPASISDRQKRFNRETHTFGEPGGWQNFPTQSPICGRDDGLPTELDGITFPKWRNESIKAYGNAVVPQLVLQIFKAIQCHANNHQAQSTTSTRS